MNGGIDTKALETTIKASKWDTAGKLDFVELVRKYAIDSEVYVPEKTVVNL